MSGAIAKLEKELTEYPPETHIERLGTVTRSCGGCPGLRATQVGMKGKLLRIFA
jgi:hypothetical protein